MVTTGDFEIIPSAIAFVPFISFMLIILRSLIWSSLMKLERGLFSCFLRTSSLRSNCSARVAMETYPFLGLRLGVLKGAGLGLKGTGLELVKQTMLLKRVCDLKRRAIIKI